MRAIARRTLRRKSLLSCQSSGRSKSRQLAVEVEVELAARLVEPGRGLQHPRGDPRGELVEELLGVRFGSPTPDESARRGGQQQRPEGRIDGCVGDVEQPLRGGARRRPRRQRRSSCELLPQSLYSLVQAAAGRLRRAAQGGGDLGVGEVAGVAQRDRGPLLRRQRPDRAQMPVPGSGLLATATSAPRRPGTAGARARGGGRSPCDGRSSAASRAGCRRPPASGRRAARRGRSPGSSPRRRCGRRRRAGRAITSAACSSSRIWNGGSAVTSWIKRSARREREIACR